MTTTREALKQAIEIADAARLRISEEYSRRRDNGTSHLGGNMDWAKLEGAVSVVQALRKSLESANAEEAKPAPEPVVQVRAAMWGTALLCRASWEERNKSGATVGTIDLMRNVATFLAALPAPVDAKPEPQIENTARGFSRINFSDRYDVPCSIQKSSLAGEDAIWIGCNNANPRHLVPGLGWQQVEMPADYMADTRMHLTQEQCAWLLPILRHFVETGDVSVVNEGDMQPIGSAFPERDASKPAEAQGIFHKFDVRRTDGSDRPGGKHYGCRYFVIDMDHDAHASAALSAYGVSCKDTHPGLSADLLREFPAQPASGAVDERESFQNAMNAARFFPAELSFTRIKSPSGRDEYENSHLQSCWEGWKARAALPSVNQVNAAQPENND